MQCQCREGLHSRELSTLVLLLEQLWESVIRNSCHNTCQSVTAKSIRIQCNLQRSSWMITCQKHIMNLFQLKIFCVMLLSCMCKFYVGCHFTETWRAWKSCQLGSTQSNKHLRRQEAQDKAQVVRKKESFCFSLNSEGGDSSISKQQSCSITILMTPCPFVRRVKLRMSKKQHQVKVWFFDATSFMGCKKKNRAFTGSQRSEKAKQLENELDTYELKKKRRLHANNSQSHTWLIKNGIFTTSTASYISMHDNIMFCGCQLYFTGFNYKPEPTSLNSQSKCLSW